MSFYGSIRTGILEPVESRWVSARIIRTGRGGEMTLEFGEAVPADLLVGATLGFDVSRYLKPLPLDEPPTVDEGWHPPCTPGRGSPMARTRGLRGIHPRPIEW
jgi:hypothetical protein